ncbi:MAG: transcriptional repressor LexA [Anaerovoracaceae bacterium]|jgi:repressor LexA|nr:transcriptional repressor LexA [Anaerovoracaceae bacterium]
MESLKKREVAILDYMKSEIKSKGYPPTVREICEALNIKSTSTTHKDIENLVHKGYIVKDPSKPRALMVVDPEDPCTPALSSRYEGNLRSQIIEIPIVGRIAAGMPVLAEENIEDYFPIPVSFAGKGTNFMLTVKGDSMVDAGILDGDYILVQQQNSANNGDIVVAMVDGFESEATVKTFYKESDHIRLQPENDTMSPILVKDVKILGKVHGVFRYL